MPGEARLQIRTTEETKKKAQAQAKELGLVDHRTGEGNISAYFELIVNLNAATGIIKKLKDEE